MRDTAATFDTEYAALSAAVRLDKSDLDNQLCEHAELFRRVCELLAAKEDELVLVVAEVDKRIRDDSAQSKEKITEVEISRRMAFDESVGKLKLTVARLRGLKEAYIERRHAFNKLSDLYGNQYWSEPNGAGRTKVAREASRERVMGAISRNRER